MREWVERLGVGGESPPSSQSLMEFAGGSRSYGVERDEATLAEDLELARKEGLDLNAHLGSEISAIADERDGEGFAELERAVTGWAVKQGGVAQVRDGGVVLFYWLVK